MTTSTTPPPPGQSSCCTGTCRQGRDCPNRRHSAGGNGNGNGNVLMLVLLLLCFVGLLAFVGPALDDHSAERAQADSLNDAVKAEQAKERFARAAAQTCGNAGWVEVGDGAIQCITRIGGRKALVAKVQP